MKPRKDTFEMPQVPLIEIPKLREGGVGGVGGGIRRGSIKRQSEIVREKKKSRQEEREEEKLRQASYFRKVTGESPLSSLQQTTISHETSISSTDRL